MQQHAMSPPVVPAGAKLLFIPGELTCSPAAAQAIKQAGLSRTALILLHATGHWEQTPPDIVAHNLLVLAGQSADDTLVSHFTLPGEVVVVLSTMFLLAPRLRWTDIVLSTEIDPRPEAPEEEIEAEEVFEIEAGAELCIA